VELGGTQEEMHARKTKKWIKGLRTGQGNCCKLPFIMLGSAIELIPASPNINNSLSGDAAGHRQELVPTKNMELHGGRPRAEKKLWRVGKWGGVERVLKGG